MRESQRLLNHSVREMDREVVALGRQEAKLKVDIRKLAAQGQMVELFCLTPTVVCSSPDG